MTARTARLRAKRMSKRIAICNETIAIASRYKEQASGIPPVGNLRVRLHVDGAIAERHLVAQVARRWRLEVRGIADVVASRAS